MLDSDALVNKSYCTVLCNCTHIPWVIRLHPARMPRAPEPFLELFIAGFEPDFEKWFYDLIREDGVIINPKVMNHAPETRATSRIRHSILLIDSLPSSWL